MSAEKKICIGVFGGAHGVHGDAKVTSFTEDPMNLTAYGPVATEDGTRVFTLKIKRALKGATLLVSAKEITSREDAESLRGKKLYIDRDLLPDIEEDEYYIEDLVGLDVKAPNGDVIGKVKAVHNFGGGDIIEVSFSASRFSEMIEFARKNIPVIEIAQSYIELSDTALDSLKPQKE